MSSHRQQAILYRRLIVFAQELSLTWGMDNMPFQTLQQRLLKTLYQAHASGLSLDEIRTALQIGEYQGSDGIAS